LPHPGLGRHRLNPAWADTRFITRLGQDLSSSRPRLMPAGPRHHQADFSRRSRIATRSQLIDLGGINLAGTCPVLVISCRSWDVQWLRPTYVPDALIFRRDKTDDKNIQKKTIRRQRPRTPRTGQMGQAHPHDAGYSTKDSTTMMQLQC
jgi:hypothetical protein